MCFAVKLCSVSGAGSGGLALILFPEANCSLEKATIEGTVSVLGKGL